MRNKQAIDFYSLGHSLFTWSHGAARNQVIRGPHSLMMNESNDIHVFNSS